MDCRPPGSFVNGILLARILEWGAISSSGDLRNPGIKPITYSLLHWQVDSLPLVPTGKPLHWLLLPSSLYFPPNSLGCIFHSLAPLFLHHPTLDLLLQPQVDFAANQSCSIVLVNSLHPCQKIISNLFPASLQCPSLLLTLCSRPDFSFHWGVTSTPKRNFTCAHHPHSSLSCMCIHTPTLTVATVSQLSLPLRRAVLALQGLDSPHSPPSLVHFSLTHRQHFCHLNSFY